MKKQQRLARERDAVRRARAGLPPKRNPTSEPPPVHVDFKARDAAYNAILHPVEKPVQGAPRSYTAAISQKLREHMR